MPETITKNEQETQEFAQKISKSLKKGDVLCLYGNLGAGKTVFAREIIRFLTKTPDLDVPSPTFTLIQTYETPDYVISHFDLYRLNNPEEIFELGWEDALQDGIALIEWPDKAGPFLPSTHKRIDIETIAENSHSRKITLSEKS